MQKKTRCGTIGDYTLSRISYLKSDRSSVWWSRQWLGKYVAIWLEESGVPSVFSKTQDLKLLLHISLLLPTLILKKFSDNETI